MAGTKRNQHLAFLNGSGNNNNQSSPSATFASSFHQKTQPIQYSTNFQNFSFPIFFHRQSVFIFLLLYAVGYIIGRLEISFSWFLLFAIVLYSASSRVFRDTSRTINEILRQKKQREFKQWRETHLPKFLTGSSTTSSSSQKDQSDGVLACVNMIIDQIWRGFNSEFALKKANEFLKENSTITSTFNIQLTYLDIDNDNPPFFTSIYCSENTPKRTVIDACIEYGGGFFIQWFVQLLIPIQFLMKDLSSKVKVRVIIEYDDNLEDFGRTVSKVDVCLIEYPEINATVQMFNSLDLSSSIPSIKNQLKTGFEQALLNFVYPKSITVYKYGGNNESVKLEIDKMVVEGLEDEIKSNLFNITQLLRAINKTDGEYRERIKEQICTNILKLLFQAREPGKIPIGMTETIRNGFQILNTFTFNESGEVNENILDILLEGENLLFIAEVVRKCSLADELVLNVIFKIKDPKLKKKVNDRFKELQISDILFIVVGRNPRPNV
ncbi:hypothetical protein ABK040_008621 [Willaertia magna]